MLATVSHSTEAHADEFHPHRQVLPETRSSITHKFCIGNHEGYLTIGMHQDGRPGEIFIKMSKEGSTMSGMCQAFCRAFSLALQYGLTLDDAVVRFKGMRFEPMGTTSNPEIPDASSIVDYVAKFLELNFGERRAE
jgi:ribonucleoside-diphosphate reductase alpha chain